MSEYTPSTNEIREAYIWQDYEDGYHGPCPRDGEEFDRWLANVKAEVAAKVLEDARDLVQNSDDPNAALITHTTAYRSND